MYHKAIPLWSRHLPRCCQEAEPKPPGNRTIELSPLLWAQKNLFVIWWRASRPFLPFQKPLLLSSSCSSLRFNHVLDLGEDHELQSQTLHVSIHPCHLLAVSPRPCYTPASVPQFLCKMVITVPLFEDREGWIFKPLRTWEEIESFLITGHAKILIGSLLSHVNDFTWENYNAFHINPKHSTNF